MAETIFDLIDEPISEGKQGYFDLAKKAPQPKDNSFLKSVKDYAKTFLKGSAEGIIQLGQIMGPLQTYEPSEKLSEKQTEALNELLPTEEEGFAQKSLRRGLKQAPTAIAFPGQPIQAGIRSLLSGTAGQVAEELGAPEWLQSAAELTAFIGPDITKKLLTSGKNEDLIKFAKKMGMTDAEITPLIQSDFKQKWLSKISPKRGSTQISLENTKKSLDRTYDTLKKGEQAVGELSEKANGELINSLYSKLSEMPREIQNGIKDDLMDLLNNKITGRSLINFYKDINSKFSSSTKELSQLKDPIKKAIFTISPELGKDFEMVNELYTKYYPIASKLKPTLVSDLISAGEYLGILGSFTMGYYPPLISIFGEKIARKFAQQMLINPHLQQISSKIVDAMNQNKSSVVKKLVESLSSKVKKSSPEVSKELDKISLEEIQDLLKNK